MAREGLLCEPRPWQQRQSPLPAQAAFKAEQASSVPGSALALAGVAALARAQRELLL